jgi:periplasmic divalent cation tolerance protein
MSDATLVLVTVGSDEEASKIGKTVVHERLAACCNIIPRIRSIYWWKGEVCEEEERLLIMKTRPELYPALQARIRQLHSYEVPEVISFSIDQGLPEYLRWVVESTREA